MQAAILNLAGWIFLLVSTLGVTSLTVWCFWRVLTLPESSSADEEESGESAEKR